MSAVIWPHLSDPAARDAARFGGKSAQLAGLAMFGVPIPSGFAIPTDAVQSWQRPLLPRIEAEIARLSDTDEHLVAARIAEIFAAQPLGDDLRRSLHESCARHLPAGPGTPVAVRSSAVGEDAAEASFAGQFESVLGVSGPDRIADALRRVWASLYSARAIRYRHRNGLPSAAGPMGVTVLAMVDARASGVAFSVDAATGKDDRVVVEATLGLAEPLVQGAITPDRFTLDKEEGRLMSAAAGDKSVLCRMDPTRGGTLTTRASDDERASLCLSEEEAIEIGNLAARLEMFMGHAVDIEWAISATGGLCVLQIRPVSATLPRQKALVWDPAECLAAFG